jgi:hypothetical protein
MSNVTKLTESTNEGTFFYYPLWNYFTSEQLFGPTGSLKQSDIAITAASIDASSPCISQKNTHQFFNTTLHYPEKNPAQPQGANSNQPPKNIVIQSIKNTSPSLSNKKYFHISLPIGSRN